MIVKDKIFVERIKTNYKIAGLTNKEETILDYVTILTRKPADITKEETNKLFDVGCTDLEILDICQIASYFNFVNRMAEGLGVQLEKEYIKRNE